MYKKTTTNYVIRISDNVCIPDDIKNKDYAEYLEWIKKGNTVLPIDPIPIEEQDRLNKEEIKKAEINKIIGDTVIKYLTTHTAEEINTYIQTNITDLASVKNVLAKLAIAAGVALRG